MLSSKTFFCQMTVMGESVGCGEGVDRARMGGLLQKQSPEFKFRFVFFPFKYCVSQLSVDRFGNKFEGVMTLDQIKSS